MSQGTFQMQLWQRKLNKSTICRSYLVHM